MVVFFLLVGLEIKREVVEGELSRPSQVALPIAGALGGIARAGGHLRRLHLARSGGAARLGDSVGDGHRLRRGVLAALGKRVPAGLKLFLLTLAIVDDLAAIVIIAIFYTADLSIAVAGAGRASASWSCAS